MSEKIDLYKVLYPAFKFELNRRMDIETHGRENILDTPAVYVANHVRMEDSPIIAMLVTQESGLPLRFVAKQEYFEGEGLGPSEDGSIERRFGRTLKLLVEYTRMINVDREEVDMEILLRDSSKLLQNGDALALHAEGTRIDDGKLYRFRPGAAAIAIANNVPLVPTGVVYTEYSNKKKVHADVLFGDALYPADFAGPFRTENRQKLDLTTAAEISVAQLTGMERTKKAAKLRKHRTSDAIDTGE